MEHSVKEKVLVKACQNGDKQAFEELIRLFFPYVSGFLLKMTGNQSLSEDLTQDTFVKMIRFMDSFDLQGKASFGTWLITIAKNCYLDWLRKNGTTLEDIDDLTAVGETIDGGAAEEAVRHIQFREAMQSVADLPREQGLVIRLKYVEELTLDEISEQLNIPAKTVKSRIYEGTRTLRERLFFKRKDL